MRRKGTIALLALAMVVGSLKLADTVVTSPDTSLAILVGIVPGLFCLWVIIRDRTDRSFLMRVFVAALLLRCIVAFFIYSRNAQLFFGPDAQTYDGVGNVLARAWIGLGDLTSPYMALYSSTSRPGWGMFYLVGAVYYVIGQNPLAIQLLNCVFGAAACVAVYKIAQLVYPQQRVARTASLLIAFSPSMILWSSQLLKDAPIVLCLCLSALYALRLRDRFSVKSLLLLLLILFCLYSLRHYALYIMFVAIIGSMVVAAKKFTPVRVLQSGMLVVVLGGALAYLGATNVQPESFDLKRIQFSRQWAAKVSNTGFGGDVDITDPTAAISFLPVGLLYVLFAPFPWMINNLRQLITLPELVIWWALVPMLIKGYWFAIRRRLKESFAICVFTLGLTVAYALFQTNVGTAYRHRAQLYVFFIIFISIGIELRREARLKRRAQFAVGDRAFAAIVPGPLTSAPISPRTQ